MRVKIKGLTFGKKYEIEGFGGMGGVRFHFTRKNKVFLYELSAYTGKIVWSQQITKKELKRYLKSEVVRWVEEVPTDCEDTPISKLYYGE